METPPTENPSNIAERNRCYGCFRPRGACFCDEVPSIANRTEVLIFQHVRERFHPFNTARMVHKALERSQLFVDQTAVLAAMPLPLEPRAGLLYPGPKARLLSDLTPDDRPEQLVIVDGTWHHAKTLVRDIPLLRNLPRYGILPSAPGRYRIRREPTATSLSTVEAVVAALRILEPETSGLDRLLAAFESMIERQLAHPRSQAVWRKNRRRNRTRLGIPRVLVQDPASVVVAYGESSCGLPGSKRSRRVPIYWVAERMGTGESFACAIQPESPLSEAFLGHLELVETDWTGAASLDGFRDAWRRFLRPTDTVAVYSQGTARLLKDARADFAKCLVLKAIPFRSDRPSGTLAEVLAAEGLAAGRPRHRGRAGKRLANAVALVRHLNELGAASAISQEISHSFCKLHH